MSWLIDKSALVRLGQSPDSNIWAERINQREVRVCTVTLLEVGFSARSGKDLRQLRKTPPLNTFLTEYLTRNTEDRAVEVQMLLADRGYHRAPSIPDLLIAACAEKASLTVLHVDKDFDLIADITGQKVERLRVT
jgi:predicted nucleic acid-binding protein